MVYRVTANVAQKKTKTHDFCSKCKFSKNNVRFYIKLRDLKTQANRPTQLQRQKSHTRVEHEMHIKQMKNEKRTVAVTLEARFCYWISKENISSALKHNFPRFLSVVAKDSATTNGNESRFAKEAKANRSRSKQHNARERAELRS